MKTTRLDDLLAEIGDIDFLKMDVQGAELDVIKGATVCMYVCICICICKKIYMYTYIS